MHDCVACFYSLGLMQNIHGIKIKIFTQYFTNYHITHKICDQLISKNASISRSKSQSLKIMNTNPSHNHSISLFIILLILFILIILFLLSFILNIHQFRMWLKQRFMILFKFIFFSLFHRCLHVPPFFNKFFNLHSF